MRRVLPFLGRWLRRGLLVLGGLVLVVWALCFTNVPWRWYRWLSAHEFTLREPPDYIVVLGGGGIPSESGLMRSYAAAAAAREFTEAMVVVAMPDARDPSTRGMLDEIVLRGIKRERLMLEDQGRNTWEQARHLRRMLAGDGVEPAVLLITSPDHMRRAVGALRKAGFRAVGSRPADSVAVAADLSIEPAAELGGRAGVPNVGSLQLRYGVWNNFGLLNRCVRESTALLYYRAEGWN
jgi:uncharacterized SAM-binding protein YcdF (DUF218 family)